MRDLLSLHAVEAGLPQGAQAQAAAMMLAALHSHLQNVTSSIITKIRANRQMGIRVTGIEHDGDSRLRLLTDANNGSLDDDSFDSSFVDDSPVMQRRGLHSTLHDSSSVSSGSASLGVSSGADSSMVSLISTAPTSIVQGSTASSDNASNVDVGGPVSVGNLDGVKAGTGFDPELGDLTSSTDSQMDSIDAQRAGNVSKDGTSRMELRHMSFLLDLAPHAIVEPLGQGSHERLLAADWTSADDHGQRQYESTPEGIIQQQARISANAKMSNVAPRASGQGANSARNKYIIDQLAPIRLFDRRTLAETQANSSGNGWSSSSAAARPKKGGLSLPTTMPVAPLSAQSSSENSSADDVPQRSSLTSDELEGVVGETNIGENYAADLAAIIASRYGTHPTLSVHPSAAAHHRGGQDGHLYEVVDPAALLSTIAA